MGNPVIIKVVMNIGNNGLYDLLLSCWIKLGIGGEDGMTIISRDGDVPGRYIPPPAVRTFILFIYCGD